MAKLTSLILLLVESRLVFLACIAWPFAAAGLTAAMTPSLFTVPSAARFEPWVGESETPELGVEAELRTRWCAAKPGVTGRF